MRQPIFFIIVCLSCPQIIFAQNSFERVLHFNFENAAGLKDTIEVRIDTLIQYQPELFSSVYYPDRFIADTVFAPDPDKRFEVYTLPWTELVNYASLAVEDLTYGFHPTNYYFFKDVTINITEVFPYPDRLFFIFRCKPADWPITMTWDHTYYAGLDGYDALKQLQMIPESLPFTLPDAYPGTDFDMDPDKYQCLSKSGTWTFNLGRDEDYSVPWAKMFAFMPGVQDTMWSFLMIAGYNGCFTVQSLEPDDHLSKWTLSPNPTEGILYLGSQSVNQSEWMIYSAQGQRMPVQFTGPSNIDVSSYPPGMYLISYKDGRRSHWKRFLKL